MQVSNIWVAVYEESTAQLLTEQGVPCFDARSMLQFNPDSALFPATYLLLASLFSVRWELAGCQELSNPGAM